MKVKTTYKEVEIGKKGDLILIRAHGKENYSFGKLEGIIEEEKPTKSTASRAFGQLTGNTVNVQYIEFIGDSYRFGSINVIGMEFPYFIMRTKKRFGSVDSSRYFDVRTIEEVVSGIDNIYTHLKNLPDKKYHAHADLIRKIAEKQKKILA